jgi:hypothetical protein
VLLTRLPLGIATSFDLHVLGTPPALVLSQDQTLHKKLYGALIGSMEALLLPISVSSTKVSASSICNCTSSRDSKDIVKNDVV